MQSKKLVEGKVNDKCEIASLPILFCREIFLALLEVFFSRRTDATSGNAWKKVFFQAPTTRGISLIATKFTMCSCGELRYNVSFTLVIM